MTFVSPSYVDSSTRYGRSKRLEFAEMACAWHIIVYFALETSALPAARVTQKCAPCFRPSQEIRRSSISPRRKIVATWNKFHSRAKSVTRLQQEDDCFSMSSINFTISVCCLFHFEIFSSKSSNLISRQKVIDLPFRLKIHLRLKPRLRYSFEQIEKEGNESRAENVISHSLWYS